jgi:hypothetical protein
MNPSIINGNKKRAVATVQYKPVPDCSQEPKGRPDTPTPFSPITNSDAPTPFSPITNSDAQVLNNIQFHPVRGTTQKDQIVTPDNVADFFKTVSLEDNGSDTEVEEAFKKDSDQKKRRKN